MADLPSLWVLEQPSTRAEQIIAMEERAVSLSRRIADKMAPVIEQAVTEFVMSLPSETMTASGDYGALDKILQTWLATGDETLLPAIERAYGLGAQSAVVPSVERFSVPTGLQVELNMAYPPNANAYVLTRSNYIKGAGDVVFATIRNEVSNAVRLGLGPADLASVLSGIDYLDSTNYMTIARTELLSAHSLGQWQTGLELGEYGPREKSWDSTMDMRTRDTHRAMNRDRLIPRPTPFEVGDTTLMFPRAPGGDAAEVINCRCAMLEWYSGDKRPDGTVIP
jgi:hypothetical protein